MIYFEHFGRMMRILLISANREPFPEPVFPIGTVYVGGALAKEGAEVRILDMRQQASVYSLKKEVTSFNPDTIGISLRNVDNAAYPSCRFYLPSYVSLMQSLRAISDVPIILGGAAFSLFPEEITAHLGADGGVKGEGEKAIGVFREPGRNKIMREDLLGGEEISFPGNIGELFRDFRKYRTIGVQTARGCPNRCIYCTYPYLEGRKRRTRSPEIIAAEIAMLFRDLSLKDFFIVDSLFNEDEEHMVRVLERLAALALPIRISCYLKPKISSPGIFRLLKRAGCVAVDFGTDSGSPDMLASLRKPFTEDDVRKASAACGDAGIDFCHSLVFGAPGETLRTIRETVRLMDEVSPKAVVAMTGIRIYPGTALELIAAKEGVVTPGESLLEPRFYFSHMGPSKLVRMVYQAAAERRNWFFPGRKDWSSTIGYRLLRFLYRKGPLWRTFER